MLDVLRFLKHESVAFRQSTSNVYEIKINCPVCGGYEKLWVNVNKGLYYCHKCQWNPNDRDFVRKFTNKQRFELEKVLDSYQSMPDNFDDYITEALSTSIQPLRLSSYTSKVSAKASREPLALPDGFYPYGHPRVEAVTSYLARRGIDAATAKRLGLGGAYAGKYHGYAILPVYEHGRLTFWQAREALGRDKLLRYTTPSGYSGTETLFNIDTACQHPWVVLCEGVFSALAVGETAVASFGNRISQGQVDLLRARGVKQVIVCHDPDSWTVPKAARHQKTAMPAIVRTLNKLLGRFHVRVLKPVGGDPDELGHREINRQINQLSMPVRYIDDLITTQWLEV